MYKKIKMEIVMPINYVVLLKDLIASDEILSKIPSKYLPGSRAQTEAGILYSCWKKEALSTDLSRISGQQAKMVQILRKKGFIFYKSGNTNWTKGSASGLCREIVGWKKPEIDLPKSYCTLSKKEKADFLRDKRDPFTNSKINLQIDHREPVEASLRYGKQPAVLTRELISSGEADKYFQVIENSTNAIKREACIKCLAGENIPIPQIAINLKNSSFKRRWNFLNDCYKTCEGCFWFDYTITEDKFKESNYIEGGYNT